MVVDQEILAVLREIPDPELPISIVDLGLVEDITIEGDDLQDIHVQLLPTFIGCPALDMIARDVQTKVSDLAMVSTCKVTWIFDPPWSVERISDAGRTQLMEHGVTVPSCGTSVDASQETIPLMTSAIPCPYCGSQETRLDSPYGPTRCRSIYFCDNCRNQFEHMKPVKQSD